MSPAGLVVQDNLRGQGPLGSDSRGHGLVADWPARVPAPSSTALPSSTTLHTAFPTSLHRPSPAAAGRAAIPPGNALTCGDACPPVSQGRERGARAAYA